MKDNIFFFISKFNYGGAGNAIFTFLKKFNTKKYNLHIFFIGDSDYENILPKKVFKHKITINTFFLKTFFSFFKIQKILKQQNNKYNKNFFISNIHYSNVLTIFFLRNIENLKIILFERTSLRELDIYINLVSYIKNLIIKKVLTYTYNKADKVLTNSIVLKNELKNFKIRSSVIYSGSIKKINFIKSHKVKKKFYNFLAVGRLDYQKDYFTLINAVKLVKKNNFILRICGEGILKKRITDYIKKNNLQKKIILCGHITDISKMYKKSDLLIHTSLYEGLPNTIVEALNYNIPIIASDSFGGTREILNNGKYGYLFKPKDIKKLSKLIEKFIINPNLFRNKTIKSKSYLKKFTHKFSSNSLEKVLLSI